MAKLVKEIIIKALANKSFVSGQVLAEQLGISRAAIAKHIKSLSEMGLDIYRVTGKGYQLAEPLSLLNNKQITDHINNREFNAPIEIHHIIDSTNSYLVRKLPNQLHHGQVCLAEYQSAGRGRRGRQWISPFGSHLYFSMYWYLEQGMAMAMGLNVVCALALSDTIKELYNIDVELKWPNDIYLNGKKLAGILIDLEGQHLEGCHCIIGIGLNVNMPSESADLIDQPWSDLQSQTSEHIDRNMLSAKLIDCLWQRLMLNKDNGLKPMIDDWHKLDLYLNKPVKVITGEKQTLGICRGINAQGALMLEVEGQITPVYGGEVSLRGLDATTC